MTWPVVLAVLCGALLHASWNALVKGGDDKPLDTALVQGLGSLLALPLLAFTGLPGPAAWPFIAASAVVHIGYYIALAGAYQHGDLGLTYLIMRGFAPLLVALGSGSLIGEAPSVAAWAGVGAITVGVVLVGLAQPGEALQHRQALLVVNGIAYPVWVWWRRGPAGRPQVLAYARRRWPLAALGGAASLGAYAIALWAMTQAPVASVTALRETSVLFAALLDCWLLKERFGLQRALGTVVIVVGVVALRFS